MIVVDKHENVVGAYVYEGYRRLFEHACNKDMVYGDFDYMCRTAPKGPDGRIDIPFEDYYCPRELYEKIVNELLNTPYRLYRGKKVHKLKDHEHNSVSCNIALGCSPVSTPRHIIRNNPNAVEFRKAFEKDDRCPF